MEKFNIALDGPAGAGKSTIARLVAHELGFIYIDTGAMYRAITWKVQQEGIHADNIDQVISLARSMNIELVPGDVQQIIVDGQNITELIRTPAVTSQVSQIAAIGPIRELLVSMQKKLAVSKGVVMDGRDIGSHVLPDAEVKVFLTASVQIRASRRYDELKEAHPELTLQQLEADIALRDKMDGEREVSPLVKADDAILLDSSELSIPQVVDRILGICQSVLGKGV